MLYEKFLWYLEKEDKAEAVTLALDALKNGEIDIVNLYTEVLIPALNEMNFGKKDESLYIWKEHFRTSVVRTIIECCYPLVIMAGQKESKKKGKKKVLIFCPSEEYHDLGARMMADFFTLCGHKTFYIGGNTPSIALLYAMEHLKPEVIAMGVSNYFNLVAAKKTIAEVRNTLGNEVSIILGGSAFSDNISVAKDIGGNFCVSTYNDVVAITEGWEKHEISI
ncbi:cobalamin B12-binding domain-containing protein [Acetobacterium bakii]|uniref:B12-binding domain-containing protein n=1 Tax=Acetobacterium bakii TaxID=52689 RepID=A0A0L6TWS1_9FIRM|nr:cobalamin-dependent protein [Acetobacterium bakii]KNZ40517.1 hypothetical protein AKG39_17215 [Acetobacterium bakii]